MIDLLATGQTLPQEYYNHRLKGDFEGFEECHIRGDWLLIYERDTHMLVLTMIRTGTHAELFGL